MVTYFSDPINTEDPSFFNVSHGFYFKNEEGGEEKFSEMKRRE